MSKITVIRPGETVEMDPTDPALAHGFGLFETICVREGAVEFWLPHWHRLCRAAEAVGIPLSIEPDAVLSVLAELVSEQATGDQVTVKLSLLNEAGGPRLLVYTRPTSPPPKEVGVLLDREHRLNERALLAGLKTHNYMENHLLMKAARRRACFDVLRLDTRGYLAEGALSNIFWTVGGRIFTPDVTTGLLPGVVRCALMESLEVEASHDSPEVVLSAEGVFLTNSSVGVLPVDWIECDGARHAIGSTDTPVWQKLQRSYHESVRQSRQKIRG